MPGVIIRNRNEQSIQLEMHDGISHSVLSETHKNELEIYNALSSLCCKAQFFPLERNTRNRRLTGTYRSDLSTTDEVLTVWVIIEQNYTSAQE